MRSNNGRLLESMYEGMKPKMETDMETGVETDMETDEEGSLNKDDESISEPTPVTEATLANELKDSSLNADESEDNGDVEPFGTIVNSKYATY
jgi:hypothetical protein